MRIIKQFAAALLFSTTVAAGATELGAGISPQDADIIVNKLKISLPQLQIDRIANTSVPGLVEILSQGQVVYLSKDAEFLLDGKMYEIATRRNLTDETIAREMNPMRAKLMSSVDEKSFITFKSPNEKYKIVVFTDVDCPYCQKFHHEVPQLNALGVTVQYAAFPRAGKDSLSYKKMVSVWCADDKLKAMDVVKGTRNIDMKLCENNPVDLHMSLVPQLGIRGTPAIVLQDGQLIPGYKPAVQLFEQLESIAKQNAVANAQ